jgi:hypothetical protein
MVNQTINHKFINVLTNNIKNICIKPDQKPTRSKRICSKRIFLRIQSLKPTLLKILFFGLLKTNKVHFVFCNELLQKLKLFRFHQSLTIPNDTVGEEISGRVAECTRPKS